MVKKICIVVIFLLSEIWAEEIVEQKDIFETNCISCHKPLSIGLDKIFFRYLGKYSSELSVKSAMIDFLKEPNRQTSAMSQEQIRRLGIKSKTHLSDKELEEAVDIYWEKYKVFGKLW